MSAINHTQKETALQSDELHKLAGRAISGNRASLEHLTERFHAPVFRMVFYRTRSRPDAEDITQEVFIKMFESIQHLKDPKAFKPWLYRIALNRVRDHARKKSILRFFGSTVDMEHMADSGGNPGSFPEHDVVKREFFEQIHQFTQKLARFEKEVFLLRFVDGLGIREIAEVMKKNESTVKTHLYRALKKFKASPRFRDLVKGGVS